MAFYASAGALPQQPSVIASVNSTSTLLVHLMDALLGIGQSSPLITQFIMFAQHFVGSSLGLDPSAILTLAVFVWGTSYIIPLFIARIISFVECWLMASISISEDDPLYQKLMKNLCRRPGVVGSRRLATRTDLSNDQNDQVPSQAKKRHGCQSPREGLSFAAKPKLNYIPEVGVTMIWHGWTLIRIERRRRSLMRMNGWGPTAYDTEDVTVSCFGLSTGPVQRFLEHVNSSEFKKARQHTKVYRCRSDIRHCYNPWVTLGYEEHGDLGDVVLDPDVKKEIVENMHGSLISKERRGYMFFGPPGTGKTSFVKVLAGHFGLDIYTILLAKCNDDELQTLFSKLPQRCIVLLEDIDSCGIGRDKLPEKNEPQPGKSVSLSGLLNVFDGVGSHRSRTLIMTTNRLRELDEALIRPGRVDMTVKFSLATEEQARGLFERTYCDARTLGDPQSGVEDVQGMARKFGGLILPNEVSTADIVAFLRGKDREPVEAVEDFKEWLESKRNEKSETR